ncbi:L-histidine N(alpha)-methyltransferase [Chloroflexi bacterium TSY]|nr:L-histidine N(alpha)-methyltransferase [Chloroflexi bacterium TSY]
MIAEFVPKIQRNGSSQATVSVVDQTESLDSKSDSLVAEVLRGLRNPVKTLPTKLLYDERGSQLFDEITELEEYYPTRTETAIMLKHINEMVDVLGANTMLIEYGSGSSIKTRILLDHLPDLAAYVPIDISAEHLAQATAQIRRMYPGLEVLPVSADYTSEIELPKSTLPAARRVIYFPGSTIGNFHPREAIIFLQRLAHICGNDGGVLIGVDLKKDPNLLHRAYNDAPGVTAAFNLNMLTHLNRRVGANFVVENFRHYAFYNANIGRIEMHLVNLADQQIQIHDQSILLRMGESIWTESSYKYTINEFGALAAKAGFQVEQVWTDERKLFSVQYLRT